ncbi:MAG: DMT family transporter [Promethearchaeota archaeon]
MDSALNILIGFLIGILAYTLLYIGKGMQKLGIETLKEEKSVKNSRIWIFGTILTIAYMFIQWGALLFAPINIIAPLDAFGLIILLFFSYRVLKENIIKIQMFGIVLILIGTIFITLFNTNPSEIGIEDLTIKNYTILSIIIIGAELIFFIIMKLSNSKYVGIILSITAGTFMGVQTVAKRITAIQDETITIAFTYITFALAIITLILTQFAYANTEANIAVPCFTSASIIIAIIASITALNEIIIFIQIVGIALIIGGIIFLTAIKKADIT